MPSQADCEFYAGNAVTLRFGPVLDRNGEFVNLITSSATWTLSRKNTSSVADIILEKSTSDPAQMRLMLWAIGNWFVEVYLQKSDTLLLKEARYYHEATVFDSFGKPTTIAAGRFTLRQTLIAETIG